MQTKSDFNMITYWAALEALVSLVHLYTYLVTIKVPVTSKHHEAHQKHKRWNMSSCIFEVLFTLKVLQNTFSIFKILLQTIKCKNSMKTKSDFKVIAYWAALEAFWWLVHLYTYFVTIKVPVTSKHHEDIKQHETCQVAFFEMSLTLKVPQIYIYIFKILLQTIKCKK